MRDLMIDIETLGNRPGSIILSIGAVTFDAETGAMGDDFYASIDSETAAAAGLTSDVSTMIWWLKQSKEASDAAFSGTQPIGAALADFAAFVLQREPGRVWAKPPSFDLVMIEAALRACDIQIPWHFATHRDCRTIFDLTATKPTVAGTAHNALDDAKAQALAVIEAYQKPRQAPPENHVRSADLTNEQKEMTLLRIIEAMKGTTDSSESQHSWLNWFCSDEIHNVQEDTFNRCNDKGWLHTTHNSDWDTSTTTLTAAGRAALATTEGHR
jgi:hypothetical protein